MILVKPINLKGKQFGKLTAIKPTKKRENGSIVWLCRCNCGNLVEVRANKLKPENVKSCGCLHGEKVKKHGESHPQTRLYRIWQCMKVRCYTPSRKCYYLYGGKGIKVYSEWKNDYLAFKKWALANGYQDHLTIDRINNDGDYSPNNCQWLTLEENARKSQVQSRRKYRLAQGAL